jgi:hypothetical protein
MYCPSCGAQNNDDVRFCRKCGADLRVVSQAITKRLSWWKYIATKIDDRLEAKRQKQDYSKGFVEIYHAAMVLIIGIFLAIFNYDRMVVFLILVALSLLGFGIRDYWIYRRRLKHEYHPDPLEVKTQLGDLSIYKPHVVPSDEEVKEPRKTLAGAPSTEALPNVAPPSVTEQTTERLKTGTTAESKNSR